MILSTFMRFTRFANMTFQWNIRNASRMHCVKDAEARITTKACPTEHQFSFRAEKSKPKSMWEKPFCMINQNNPIRLDDVHYKATDKWKANFQQTWASCPQIKFAEVPVCTNEQNDVIPIEKRTARVREKTACPIITQNCKINRKCGSAMPNCKEDRLRSRYLSFTEAIKANPPETPPCRSYSEAIQLHRRGKECKCLKLDKPTMCLLWLAFRRRLS